MQNPIYCKHYQRICLICKEKTDLLGIDPSKSNEQIQDTSVFQECNEDKKLFENLCSSIVDYRKSLNKGLDEILDIIIEQIESTEAIEEKFQSNLPPYNQTIDILKKECQNQLQSNEKVKTKVQKLLRNYQNNNSIIDNLFKMLTEKQKVIQIDTTKEQSFQFDQIEQADQVKINECRAFDFFSQYNNLMVTCDNEIIVYQITNDTINTELQRIQIPNQIGCSVLMTYRNSFAIGCLEKIIIFGFNSDQISWYIQAKFKSHEKKVKCILMTEGDEFMISGSDDQTIKFWKKQDKTWTCYYTVYTNTSIQDMSLDRYDSILITSGTDTLIYVFQKYLETTWRIIQVIDVNSKVLRHCFGDKSQIIVLSSYPNKLKIYTRNNQVFEFLESIQIQEKKIYYQYFWCQYNKQSNFVLVQHGKYLNLFQITEGSEYELLQTIQFKNENFISRLTNDSQYLITWENESKLIKIRKLTQFK